MPKKSATRHTRPETRTHDERRDRLVAHLEKVAASGDLDTLRLASDVIDVLADATTAIKSDPNALASAILSHVESKHPWLTDRMSSRIPAFMAGYFAEVV